MDKTLKTLRPHMLDILRERFGEDGLDDRWARIEARDERFIAEEDDLGGRSNPMASTMNLMYALAAFYEELDRDFSDDEFMHLFNGAMGPLFGFLGHFDMNKLARKRWFCDLVHKIIGSYAKKVEAKRGGEWGRTWTVAANPDCHETGVAYTIYDCPMLEFAQRRGYMDLLPRMCAADGLIPVAAHGYLIRHKVLSAGDDACEYWYVGDRSPEALADEGSI